MRNRTIEDLKERIIEEAAKQGLDMETLDPTGAGVDDWMIWRVLEGTPVSEAVADWLEWKSSNEA